MQSHMGYRDDGRYRVATLCHTIARTIPRQRGNPEASCQSRRRGRRARIRSAPVAAAAGGSRHSAQEAAKAIRGSESKISRIELGRNAIREIDVLDLLTYTASERPSGSSADLASRPTGPAVAQVQRHPARLVPVLRRDGRGRGLDPRLRAAVHPRLAPDPPVRRRRVAVGDIPSARRSGTSSCARSGATVTKGRLREGWGDGSGRFARSSLSAQLEQENTLQIALGGRSARAGQLLRLAKDCECLLDTHGALYSKNRCRVCWHGAAIAQTSENEIITRSSISWRISQ